MPAASARYGVLSAVRTTVLERAREASRLTIPGIIPDDGQNEHSVFQQPYQSVGARGVAALASYLLLALFPPNVPFFRLSIDQDTAEALGQQLGEANEKLARISLKTLLMMSDIRPILMEVLRHLIVAGNVLLHIPEKSPARLFRLDQYVVKRDAAGQFMEIVIREMIYPSALTPEVRQAVALPDPGEGAEHQIEVFTRVTRNGNQVNHRQEINGKLVPGSQGSAPAEKSGWLPLRWLAIPGSDYGRAHVTEVIGDLYSLEDLSKAMVQFAAVASRIVWVVHPNSQMDVDELAEANSGDFLNGDVEKVKALQLEKSQDWAVMYQLAQRIEERVNNAFLIRAGTIRDAERVTAEEVQMVAQELETVLGGTYTVLSGELQLRLVNRYLYMAERTGDIPRLPRTIIPQVVTGFDALGRGAAVNRIKAWASDLFSFYGVAFPSVVNSDELARRLGDGIDGLGDLIKSKEQQAQEAQQAQMAQAAQAAVPNLAKTAGEAILPKE